MSAREPFRFINEVDAATVEAIITRLEFRATDARYVAMLDAYLDRAELASAAHVLTVGCGTGVEVRALARRPDFRGRVTGTDHSPALIEAARRLAAAEGVDGRVEFRVADAQALDAPDSGFDAVIGHTVLSHVADPLAVLREAARVVKPGGVVAVFDGDYASLTFSHPDASFAKTLEEALIASIVTNPRVMRDLPRVLRQVGLACTAAMAHVYADIGSGGFFANAVTSYSSIVARSGLVPAAAVERWRAAQERAAAEGTFFGACNYYAYLGRKPGAG
jgi:ubiquinone/menaquinone biosynthesis C-methylase UbiE